ncbi:hypothetical protein DPMN_178979 [Dreissena polymorpha]|uniref:Uncharacterized protein n=1 Tax=Dreissena polymorpha TaxID=45954 RepID=A0A9D4ILX9_DREPO|nr:hypothetical protein DPMN_178979 [Dreissena polymorpha]
MKHLSATFSHVTSILTPPWKEWPVVATHAVLNPVPLPMRLGANPVDADAKGVVGEAHGFQAGPPPEASPTATA